MLQSTSFFDVGYYRNKTSDDRTHPNVVRKGLCLGTKLWITWINPRKVALMTLFSFNYSFTWGFCDNAYQSHCRRIKFSAFRL